MTHAPIAWTLQIYQGATLDERRVWKSGASRESARPVDLTGAKARMQVRSSVDSPAVLLELTTENGRIRLGGPSGAIELHLSAQETAAIEWESGVHDLEIEFAGGQVRRLFAGRVKVSREVTR